ncbi:PREDICTED: egg cell-secreted protein 1.4-like [Camelina sativa]|uniref:Egg cell-secreted protein 1.4-like n=1 Tax=Camelina sativa TaxID=90675 RepID=A0ABM0U5R8_CAMSA|nr:PREDICTED: egg cell-secreted protein 1.4-like [Camelina sativa]
MGNNSRAIFSLVLVVALCAAILITPGTAHEQPPRLQSPPDFPIDLEKCWSSLFNTQGCILEVFKSVFSGKFGNVGVACCKAFSTIDANCWPHMFPLNPFFPPLLKDNCAHIVPNSSTNK